MAQNNTTNGETPRPGPRSFLDDDSTATHINTAYADQARATGGHITSLDDSRAQDDAVPAVTPPPTNTPAAPSSEEEEPAAQNPVPVPVPTQAPPAAAAAATTQAAPQAPAAPAGGAAPAPRNGPYYTFEEVKQHEHAHDFRHRGKGRWAYGLPADNAPPQTAVRGPGAEVWKSQHVGKGRR